MHPPEQRDCGLCRDLQHHGVRHRGSPLAAGQTWAAAAGTGTAATAACTSAAAVAAGTTGPKAGASRPATTARAATAWAATAWAATARAATARAAPRRRVRGGHGGTVPGRALPQNGAVRVCRGPGRRRLHRPGWAVARVGRLHKLR